MRLIITLSVIILACSAQEFLQRESAPDPKCNGWRPEVCTEEYSPVVCTQGAAKGKIYSNGCFACADTDVESYIFVNLCAFFDAPTIAIKKDDKDSKPNLPADRYSQTCGITKDHKFVEVKSAEKACREGHIQFYIFRACPV